MAINRIKGITIKINGDTTPLQKALSGVNGTLRETQNNLRDVDKLLKLDPANTELLRQKQHGLRDAIKETEEKLKIEKDALEQLGKTKQTEEVKKQQEALNREIIDTEQKLKSLKKEYREFGTVAASQLQAVGGKIQEMGSKLKDVGGKITDVGKNLTMKVTTPIAGAFTAAVTSGAEFDKQMSAVKAVTGSSAEDFERLRDAAIEQGERTSFSAKESADALYYMGLAGWDAEQSVAGLSGVLDLAAAGASELGTTSDIVTDYMTAFKMQAEESGHFANVMAAAMSNTNTTTEMLGETFKYAAPVAGALGYSLEDISIAAGVMANSGIKASTAGTTLRTIMNNLASPTESVSNAMSTLGVSLTDNEGKMLPFRNVLEQLRQSFNNGNIDLEDFQMRMSSLDKSLESGSLTKGTYTIAVEELEEALENNSITAEEYEHRMKELDNQLATGDLSIGTYEKALDDLMVSMYGAEGAQMAQYASMLAGKRGMSGLLAIVTEAPNKYQDVVNAIDNADTAYVRFGDDIYTLEEAYKKFGDAIYKDSSFEMLGAAEGMASEQLDNLAGSWTLFTSKLGSTKILVSDLVKDELRGLVEKLTGLLDTFNNLDEEQQRQIVTIAGIVAAIGPALMILGTLAGAVGNIMTIGGGLISGIGAVIGFVGGTLVPLITGTLIPAIGGLIAAAAPILAAAAPFIAIAAAIVGAGVLIYKNWDTIKEKAGQLKDFVSEKWNTLKENTSKAWGAIKNRIEENGGGIGGVLKTATELYVNTWKLGFSKIDELTGGKLSSALSTVKNKIEENGGGIGGVIKTAAQGYVKTWEWGFSKIDDLTGNKLSTALSTVKDKVEENGGGIGGVIKTATQGYVGAWELGFTKIDDLTGNKMSSALQTIKDKVSDNGGGIGGVMKTAMDGYKTIWDKGFTAIDKVTSGKLSAIKDAFDKTMTGAKEIVKIAIEKIKSFFNFNWSLPKLKMPHFSISGSFSINPPSVPHFTVDWYKKAYEGGMMFTRPTVIPTSSGLKGFGDGSGAEIVIGAENLMGMINRASNDSGVASRVDALMQIVSQYLPVIAEGGDVYLDKSILVGQITPEINRRLGLAYR